MMALGSPPFVSGASCDAIPATSAPMAGAGRGARGERSPALAPARDALPGRAQGQIPRPPFEGEPLHDLDAVEEQSTRPSRRRPRPAPRAAAFARGAETPAGSDPAERCGGPRRSACARGAARTSSGRAPSLSRSRPHRWTGQVTQRISKAVFIEAIAGNCPAVCDGSRRSESPRRRQSTSTGAPRPAQSAQANAHDNSAIGRQRVTTDWRRIRERDHLDTRTAPTSRRAARVATGSSALPVGNVRAAAGDPLVMARGRDRGWKRHPLAYARLAARRHSMRDRGSERRPRPPEKLRRQ